VSSSVLVLFHLIGFAAFVGGAVAQQLFMRRSSGDVAPAIRDEYERLSAAIVTNVELPGAFAQVLTGVLMIVGEPTYLKQHWLHAKLTCVVLLLLSSHAEMFNARRLVKARAKGDAGTDEIASRKARHRTMGVATAVLIAAVLLLVTVLRTAF
jgi:uncharacterized membrane protein